MNMPENEHIYSIFEKQTFPKKEKLTSEKEIQEVFKKGKHTNVYPLKFIYTTENLSPQTAILPKIVITVSKKLFKKAHERNLIKRLIREAYRQNKILLLNRPDYSTFPTRIAIIYIAKEILAFQLISDKLKEALLRLR
jgi:ribonuclease P protein component